MTNVSIPEVDMLKNSSKLAVSVPINLSTKLGFVSVNGPTGTHLVDVLRIRDNSEYYIENRTRKILKR